MKILHSVSMYLKPSFQNKRLGRWSFSLVAAAFALFLFITAFLAPPNQYVSYGQQRPGDRFQDGPPPGGMFSFLGGRGRGSKADTPLVAKFDANKNGWLEADERKKARVEAKKTARPSRGGWGRGGRGPGGPGQGGPGGSDRQKDSSPTSPKDLQVSPKDVKSFPENKLYDSTVLRTVFIDFPNKDWESELEDFKSTDVEVPATVTIDQTKYEKVGIKFRGNSSYMRVPRGKKRSLNLSFHMANKEQRIGGYRTLNLLNGVGDTSYLSCVLYSKIATPYIAVPKANLVKVVINGKYWGVYSNVQQINKDFTMENYPIGKGSRWKVPGRPGADGGLRYLGEDISKYKSRYEIKTKDKPEAWTALKDLCKTLHETSPENLPAALDGKLDVEGVLKFLAVDLAVVNSDGYWTRASDYCLFMDTNGKFHVIPYDMNESFMTSGRGPGGPGGRMGGRRGRRGRGEFGNRGPGRRGPGVEGQSNQGKPDENRQEPGGRPPRMGFGGFGFGGPGPEDQGRRGRGTGGRGPGGRGPGGPGGHGSHDLDPLVAIKDSKKPLHSKLLAVPQYKEKYLGYLKDIAKNQLAEKNLKPFIANYRSLVRQAIQNETKSMVSSKQFLESTSPNSQSTGSLLNFLKKRRDYLLNHKEIKSAKQISIQSTKPAYGKKSISEKQDPSNILISELMAANNRTVKSPNGKFEDWIEIWNRSEKEVDLSHYFLSDKELKLDKWQFPEGTMISPGQFLVVWADDSNQPGLHASFKLKKKGESVFLSRKATKTNKEGLIKIVDSVKFSKQTEGVSWSLIQGKWQSGKPTAGSENEN